MFCFVQTYAYDCNMNKLSSKLQDNITSLPPKLAVFDCSNIKAPVTRKSNIFSISACISQSLRVIQCSSRLEGHSLLDACSLFGKGTADTDGGLTTERIPTQTLANTFSTLIVVKRTAEKEKNSLHVFTRACQCISVLFFLTLLKLSELLVVSECSAPLNSEQVCI